MGLAPMDKAKEKFNKLKTRDGAYDMLVGEYDYKFLCMVSPLNRSSYIIHAIGWVCVRGQQAFAICFEALWRFPVDHRRQAPVSVHFGNFADKQTHFCIAAALSLPEQGERICTTTILCP